MGAKQSQEMREAVRLVQSGITQTEAAIRVGVSREALNRYLKKLKKESENIKTKA